MWGMVAASAVGQLIAAILLPCLAACAAACQAPYDGQPGSITVLAPAGQEAIFSGGLTVAVGERVLLAGTARVAGGVTVRGTLFLSSNSSSTLTADWVVVESGGTLQAGFAACPVPAKFTATIELRGGAAHPAAGRKALAVLAGGTLEVRRWVGIMPRLEPLGGAACVELWPARFGPPLSFACCTNSVARRHPGSPPPQLHGAKGLGLPWARLAATAARGATSLQLDGDAGAAGWAVGDELAIASTDYDPYQTERVTVTAVGGGGRSVQVAPPLKFMHYGEVTEGVDQRAEAS